MKAKRITGVIELENGQKVEFGLGYEEDWRSGNTRDNLGHAVDICRALDQGMLDEELWSEK